MSIYKRGDDYVLNIQVDGERIHRAVGKTLKEAREAEAKIRARARDRRLLGQKGRRLVPFDRAAREYLDHVKDTLSSRTYELEETDYRVHLEPYFKFIHVSEISNDTLKDYQKKKKKVKCEKTGQKYGNRTVNIHMGLIRKIRRYAIDKGYIALDELKYPMLTEPTKKHAFLTPAEKKAFLKNFAYELSGKRAEVQALTGLRPKEAAYLSWDDVDFEMKSIRVRSKPEDGFVIKTMQQRVIPLNKRALAILKELKKKRDRSLRKSPWVFSKTERPVLNIRRAIDTAARKAGITKKITPNMLRHTFASISLAKGANIKSIQELLGHASLGTTMKYLHAIDKTLRDAVDLLD
jgi:integrase